MDFAFLEDEAVCEICGSKQKQEVMVNCAQCNACQHRYCLKLVAFEMTGEWYCYECQKKDSGDPKPIQAPTDAGESGMKNLHHNIDMPVIISSSAEYERRPPPEAICWTRAEKAAFDEAEKKRLDEVCSSNNSFFCAIPCLFISEQPSPWSQEEEDY